MLSGQRSTPFRRVGSGMRAGGTSCGRSSSSALWTPIHGLPMTDRRAFQYTILRVVPDVERGERLNVGVVLYSPERKFLAARVRVSEERLRAIAPDLDVGGLRRHLDGLAAVAAGEPDAGPIAQLPQSERFG